MPSSKGTEHQPDKPVKLTPDIGQARRFLTALDPLASDKFTFQTFSDKKIGGKDYLASHPLHGTLEQHLEQLTNTNQRHGGVFVTVNETDLQGRKNKNVIRQRGVFADFDKGDKSLDQHLASLPLPPTIIVQSSPAKNGTAFPKYHCYWLTEPNSELSKDDFSGIMRCLVDKHGADKVAVDLARVLRVPGFHHCKSDPVLVELVKADGLRYTREQLIKAFPGPAEVFRPISKTTHNSDAKGYPPEHVPHIIAMCERALHFISADCSGADWWDVLFSLHNDFGKECAQARELFIRWSETSDNPEHKQCDPGKRWDETTPPTNAEQQKRHIVSLFHDARENSKNLTHRFICAGYGIYEQARGNPDFLTASIEAIFVLQKYFKNEFAVFEGFFHKNDRLPKKKLYSALQEYKREKGIDANKPPTRNIMVRRASDIQQREMKWLFPNRIPSGELTQLYGDPKTGKSTLAFEFAAIVSRGGEWPNNEGSCKPGNVLIISAEDNEEKVIVPMLEAAGADLDRILIQEYVEQKSKDEWIVANVDLSKDVSALEALIIEHELDLVIIDPIAAFLGSKDSHKNAEMRAILSPLTKMAQKHDCAILYINHMNKGNTNAPAMYRAMGSLAFTATARQNYLVVKDRIDPKKRLFIPSEGNYSPDDTKGLIYIIETRYSNKNIKTSGVVWSNDITNITAEEALRSNKETSSPKLDEAKAFLMTVLRNAPKGEMLVIDVKAQAREVGIKRETLEDAKRVLKLRSVQSAEFGGNWIWALPIANEDDFSHAF